MLSCLVFLSVLPVGAENLPFWGEDASATNRTCASAQIVALSSGFESRLYSTGEFSLVSFSSWPIAFVIMIR